MDGYTSNLKASMFDHVNIMQKLRKLKMKNHIADTCKRAVVNIARKNGFVLPQTECKGN